MQQLVEQSADRLDKTFQAGEQRVSTLLQQQVEQIKAVNNQITNSRDTLAKGREMLEEDEHKRYKRPSTNREGRKLYQGS